MILAIDTATRWLGVALYDGQAVLAEIGWQSQHTQTIELTPTIEMLFERAGLSGSDLSGIAVVRGPGSYTGVRVGMGVAQGMALATQVPLMGVPTLDVLAATVGRLEGELEQLLTIAEAGRKRIIAARYGWRKGGWQAQGDPEITTWEALLADQSDPIAFAGEISAEAATAVRRTDRRFKLVPPARGVRRAAVLAEIGWRRLRKKQVDDPLSLTPIYMRQPDGS